jgi:hypothetical protein
MIFFSYEATWLGHVNGHTRSFVLSGRNIPHAVTDGKTNSSNSNVFAPHQNYFQNFAFTESTLRYVAYIDMLYGFPVPILGQDKNTMLLQQHTMFPHFHVHFLAYEVQIFLGGGGTGGPSNWQLRSPDLTSLDVYLITSRHDPTLRRNLLEYCKQLRLLSTRHRT